MKSKISEGNHKVFFWAYENRCRSDVARSIKSMRFPDATGTFGFVILAGNMQTNVFRRKGAQFGKTGPSVCLSRRRERSGGEVNSVKMC